MINSFNTNDTKICKGIAIIFMVIHHVVCKYYNSFNLLWYLENSGGLLSLLTILISTVGKVCVSLFTILAGYGVYKKYIHYINSNVNYSNFKFVLSRMIKFYTIYIPIFILFIIIKYLNGWSSFYDLIYYYARGNGFLCFISNFLLDIFGFFGFYNTPSIIGSWFVTAVLVFYMLFPFFQYLTVKFKWIFVFLCNLPWVLLMIQGGIKEDIFYCYFAEFSLGILLANTGVLDKLKNKITKSNRILSLLLLLISWSLRLIFGLPADIVFAISIIIFEIEWLSNGKYISGFLSFFGKHSTNIWLLHIYVIYSFSILFNKVPIKIMVAIVISLGMSIIIEFIKNKIKYTRFMNKIITCILN